MKCTDSLISFEILSLIPSYRTLSPIKEIKESICEKVLGTKCPDLRQEPNMISPKRLTGYFYLAQVAFKCDQGYLLSSAGNLTCQASSHQYEGYWNGTQPKCHRIKCPDLRQYPNMISPTKLIGYFYQEQVAFQCAEGYSLSFEENLICQASSNQNIGHWSRNQPTCQRITCPDLRQNPNMISPTKLIGYFYQEQVAFQCAEGYSLSFEENLICQASSNQNIGHWSRNQPTCQHIKCPDLRQKPNMISPTKLIGYFYQEQVAFQCAEGYSLSFEENLICQASSNQNIGHWSRNQPTCQRKSQIYFPYHTYLLL
ncbi:unnamed protein product [Mytilus coruscus]|uniref:Sushi domain-containing protein n=1 Tax=Mytilus coruscus TaxID=42192 RepID=A0A6J8AXR9_MYTCO|nr:unnamed protein product [Mytilus coruscus]